MAGDDGGPGVFSEMSEKMRIKEGDDDRTVLSKKLSYVLRHGAKEMGLEIDDGGYVCVSDLLSCGELFEGVAIEALMEVVEQSNRDKQRYEIVKQDDGEVLIRATGKHTMQGLAAEKAARERKARRGGGKEAGGSPSNGRGSPAARGRAGSGAGGGRQLNEEEFCTRWRLDRLARARLAELPPGSRQLAMQRFNPGPQVPAGDFPKVFVAFCKRFRGKGKEDGYDEHDVDFEDRGSPTNWGSSSPNGSRSSKGKKKSKSGEALLQIAASREAADDSGSANADGGPYPAYPSPGSTPRSLDEHDSPPGAMALLGMGAPLPPGQAAPMSPPAALSTSPPLSPNALRLLPSVPAPPQSPPAGSPQFAPPASPPKPRTPPPPAYAPRTMLPANASLAAPPPPQHAPQVQGYGFGDAGQGRAGFQDLAHHQQHLGQWAPSARQPGFTGPQAHMSTSFGTAPPPPPARAPGNNGYQEIMSTTSNYGRYYDASSSYDQNALLPGYQDQQHSPGSRAQMAYVGHVDPLCYPGYADASPTGYEAHRGAVPGGAAWQLPAGHEHGACY